MRYGNQRRKREQGAALVVAVVLVFITIVAITAMLQIPEAAQAQAKRTIWRDRSLASADEGVREAAMYLTAHQSTFASGGVLYWSGSGSVTATKMYPGGSATILKVGTAANTASNATATSFVRFGDPGNDSFGYPLIGYTYSIQNCSSALQTANSYFRVTAWGWAQNPTGDNANMSDMTKALTSQALANGIDTSLTMGSITAGYSPTPDISPRNLVSRIQVILYNSVPPLPDSTFSAASMAYPSTGSAPTFGQISQTAWNTAYAAQIAGGKTAAQATDAITGNIGVINPHANDPAFFGADQSLSGHPNNNYGLAIENVGMGWTSAPGGDLPTGKSPPTGSTTTASIIGGQYGTTSDVWSTIDTVVSTAVSFAASNPSGVAASGSTPAFNVRNWGTTTTSGTYSAPDLSATTSLTYIKIADGATVSGTSLITPPTGTPGTTGGILIIDVGTTGGTGVTFDCSASVFGSLGTHQWNGTIIFYQRSPVFLTNTTNIKNDDNSTMSNTLVFATENGNQSGQAEFDSGKINSALLAIPSIGTPSFKIASYVIQK